MAVSLPLRKCGLKFPFILFIVCLANVTSLAEVWIEMLSSKRYIIIVLRHFPCGSVD